MAYFFTDIILPATQAKIAHSTNEGADPRLVVTLSEKYSKNFQSSQSCNTTSIRCEARIRRTERKNNIWYFISLHLCV